MHSLRRSFRYVVRTNFHTTERARDLPLGVGYGSPIPVAVGDVALPAHSRRHQATFRVTVCRLSDAGASGLFVA